MLSFMVSSCLLAMHSSSAHTESGHPFAARPLQVQVHAFEDFTRFNYLLQFATGCRTVIEGAPRYATALVGFSWFMIQSALCSLFGEVILVCSTCSHMPEVGYKR